MTLQSSGPLKASEIRTEFGGSGSFSLSDYYAGGPNVPIGAEGDGGPIPTSGTIKFSDFYGASNLSVEVKTLQPDNVSTIRGFIDNVIGVLTPNETLNGVQIISIYKDTAPGRVRVELNGTRAQNFWNSFIITGGPTFKAADAIFAQPSNTTWEFVDAFGFPNASYEITFTY